MHYKTERIDFLQPVDEFERARPASSDWPRPRST